MSRGKVAILNHGYLPHYRVRFYELLAERGGLEYVVFHGAPPSWVGAPELKGPFAFPQRRVDNREFRIGPLTLVYQPVIREIMTGGYDAVVITTESKFIANLAWCCSASCVASRCCTGALAITLRAARARATCRTR
jgi:hypothetical protein